MYIEKNGEKHNLYCGKKCSNLTGELFKQPNSVSKFFEDKDGKVFLDKTHTILMHTRASTSGDPAYNENNHPFNTKNFILAHNGVTQEQVIQKYPELTMEDLLDVYIYYQGPASLFRNLELDYEEETKTIRL